MISDDMFLNLLCLDRGIVQLADLSCLEKQYKSLNSADRRKVSRKIKKLAKKYIKMISRNDDILVNRLRSAGFLDAPRGIFYRARYEKVRATYAKKYLEYLIFKEKKGVTSGTDN